MLVTLPLYGLSAALAGLLGAVHFHETAPPTAKRMMAATVAPVASTPAEIGSMAGWQDFRRVDHVGGAAGHTHTGLERHHHEGHDGSAVNTGPDEGDASLGDGASPNVPSPVPVTTHPVLAARPTLAVHAAWPVQATCRVESCDARRLERPPRPQWLGVELSAPLAPGLS